MIYDLAGCILLGLLINLQVDQTIGKKYVKDLSTQTQIGGQTFYPSLSLTHTHSLTHSLIHSHTESFSHGS